MKQTIKRIAAIRFILLYKIFMQHFFINPEDIRENKVVIKGGDARHISKVLRMKEGERLLVSTGNDWDYLCSIERVEKDCIYLEIKEENNDVRELNNRIVLFQALPKSDKMELIIQKAVELGVSEIVYFFHFINLNLSVLNILGAILMYYSIFYAGTFVNIIVRHKNTAAEFYSRHCILKILIKFCSRSS